MWNEIWIFVKDNPGWTAVGIVTIGFVLYRYVYTKLKNRYNNFKKSKYEEEVPSTEDTSFRDQPEYTPLLKEKHNDLSNLGNQIKKVKSEMIKLDGEGKKLKVDESTLEEWNIAQGKIYVDRQNLISAKGERINDNYSFYFNQLKGLEKLKEQQERFLLDVKGGN